MSKIYDVTALGELLIDFTENGLSGQGNPLFEANPGGAPCNLLSMLAGLGHKVAFIGKVGNDMFGRMLKERAGAQGIDMQGLMMDEEIPTTLAFVQKLPNGDRDFSFYRKPGADIMLTVKEVEDHKDLIENARVFHFGTLSMVNDDIAAATKKAIEIARASGDIISFDPNYRAPLWSSEEAAREAICYGLSQCDVLKISDNEIALLTGIDENDEADIVKGVQQLIAEYKIPLVFATLGPNGSKAFYKGEIIHQDGFKNPDTIETTGAGDTFGGSALHFVVENGGTEGFTAEKLQELLRFANAAASIVTTKKGALAVMPKREEVEAFLASR